MSVPINHLYAKGDLVQLTRLAVKRSLTTDHRTKTEQSIGQFVRYDGWVYAKPKHPTATIKWFTGRTEHPVSYEQRVRLDYIEPLGTPR